MSWFKNIKNGLNQAAEDDVNGLVTVLMACLLDEDNRRNYQDWLKQQLINTRAKNARILTLSIYSNLTQQAAQKERQGMGPAIDQLLWKFKQGEL